VGRDENDDDARRGGVADHGDGDVGEEDAIVFLTRSIGEDESNDNGIEDGIVIIKPPVALPPPLPAATLLAAGTATNTAA
jgi:hypothetical protein